MTPPTDHEKLAIDGGEPVIKKPLPKGVSGPSVIGDEEIRAVTDVMKNKQLFLRVKAFFHWKTCQKLTNFCIGLLFH